MGCGVAVAFVHDTSTAPDVVADAVATTSVAAVEDAKTRTSEFVNAATNERTTTVRIVSFFNIEVASY